MTDKPSFPPARRATAKDARRPFGAQMQKLAYEPRDGYHRHWFNEEPGRIDAALQAGYNHVEDKEGRKVQRVVGVNPAGGALNAFLMEIPEEWYQEDMTAEQRKVDETDSAIRSGEVAGSLGKDGRYVPKDRGIKVRESH